MATLQTPPPPDAAAWIRDLLPDGLQSGEFFGLAYWQWFALPALLFLGVLADWTVRAITRPLANRIIRQFHGRAEEETLRAAVRALGLLSGAITVYVFLPALGLTGFLRQAAIASLQVFAVLAGTWIAWRVTDLVADILIHRALRTRSRFDDILVPMLRKTAKLFILAFGVIYTAQALDFNIVPLLTGLGIGGLAFAFAAKDTVENFFGSIAVVLDRPFEVGDWVLIGEIEGTVEELGFRSTRIRTFYDSQVTIPNSTLVRATVDNYGRRAHRRWKTTLGVQYDTPPEKLLAFTEGIRELVRRHPHTRKDYYQVWCNDFGASSLDILLYIFFRVPDWSTELRERERFFVDIVRLADRLGVQFAFPTQTLHLYQEKHRPAEPAYANPEEQTDRRAMATGVEAARAITGSRAWKKKPPGPVRFEVEGQALGDREAGGDG